MMARSATRRQPHLNFSCWVLSGQSPGRPSTEGKRKQPSEPQTEGSPCTERRGGSQGQGRHGHPSSHRGLGSFWSVGHRCLEHWSGGEHSLNKQKTVQPNCETPRWETPHELGAYAGSRRTNQAKEESQRGLSTTQKPQQAQDDLPTPGKALGESIP